MAQPPIMRLVVRLYCRRQLFLRFLVTLLYPHTWDEDAESQILPPQLSATLYSGGLQYEWT